MNLNRKWNRKISPKITLNYWIRWVKMQEMICKVLWFLLLTGSERRRLEAVLQWYRQRCGGGRGHHGRGRHPLPSLDEPGPGLIPGGPGRHGGHPQSLVLLPEPGHGRWDVHISTSSVRLHFLQSTSSRVLLMCFFTHHQHLPPLTVCDVNEYSRTDGNHADTYERCHLVPLTWFESWAWNNQAAELWYRVPVHTSNWPLMSRAQLLVMTFQPIFIEPSN